jgi:hypothetical protein
MIQDLANRSPGRTKTAQTSARNIYVLRSFTLAVQRSHDPQIPGPPLNMSDIEQADTDLPNHDHGSQLLGLTPMILRLRKLRPYQGLRVHKEMIHDFSICPEGKQVATASTDQTVTVFSIIMVSSPSRNIPNNLD